MFDTMVFRVAHVWFSDDSRQEADDAAEATEPDEEDAAAAAEAEQLSVTEALSPSPPPNPEEPDWVEEEVEQVPDEVHRLRFERAVSERAGLPWAQRGPLGPDQGGPRSWRGQNFRRQSGKWMNRGGALFFVFPSELPLLGS